MKRAARSARGSEGGLRAADTVRGANRCAPWRQPPVALEAAVVGQRAGDGELPVGARWAVSGLGGLATGSRGRAVGLGPSRSALRDAGEGRRPAWRLGGLAS